MFYVGLVCAEITTEISGRKSDPIENDAAESDRHRITTYFQRLALVCIGEYMFESLRILITRIFAAVLIVLILVSSSVLNEKAPLISEILSFIGMVMVGICVLGRLWCSLFIAGKKTDHLIDQGPYSLCRNPLYFFSFLGAMGIGFATGTFTIPALVLLAFSAYYSVVMKSEEVKLMEIHGSAFVRYKNTVPLFFPDPTRFSEPELYLVKTKIFRRHLLEVIWFIVLLGFLEFLKALHRADILPTLFALY